MMSLHEAGPNPNACCLCKGKERAVWASAAWGTAVHTAEEAGPRAGDKESCSLQKAEEARRQPPSAASQCHPCSLQTWENSFLLSLRRWVVTFCRGINQQKSWSTSRHRDMYLHDTSPPQWPESATFGVMGGAAPGMSLAWNVYLSDSVGSDILGHGVEGTLLWLIFNFMQYLSILLPRHTQPKLVKTNRMSQGCRERL